MIRCCGQEMGLSINIDEGEPIHTYKCSICKDGYSRFLEDINKPDLLELYSKLETHEERRRLVNDLR